MFLKLTSSSDQDASLSDTSTADIGDSDSPEVVDNMLMEIEDCATLQIDTMKQMPSLPGTLGPVSELNTQEMLQSSFDNLKQKDSSLSDYLLRGIELARDTPRRKEGLLVNAFVDGMDRAQPRSALEAWLDGGGWYWQRAESYIQGVIDRDKQMSDLAMQSLPTQTQVQPQIQRVKHGATQKSSQHAKQQPSARQAPKRAQKARKRKA